MTTIPTLFAVVRHNAPVAHADRPFLQSTYVEFGRPGVLWGVVPTTFRSFVEAAIFAALQSVKIALDVGGTANRDYTEYHDRVASAARDLCAVLCNG